MSITMLLLASLLPSLLHADLHEKRLTIRTKEKQIETDGTTRSIKRGRLRGRVVYDDSARFCQIQVGELNLACHPSGFSSLGAQEAGANRSPTLAISSRTMNELTWAAFDLVAHSPITIRGASLPSPEATAPGVYGERTLAGISGAQADTVLVRGEVNDLHQNLLLGNYDIKLRFGRERAARAD